MCADSSTEIYVFAVQPSCQVRQNRCILWTKYAYLTSNLPNCTILLKSLYKDAKFLKSMQQLMDQLTCSLYGVRGFQMDVRESQMVSGSLRWCQRISDLESFIGRYSLLRRIFLSENKLEDLPILVLTVSNAFLIKWCPLPNFDLCNHSSELFWGLYGVQLWSFITHVNQSTCSKI